MRGGRAMIQLSSDLHDSLIATQLGIFRRFPLTTQRWCSLGVNWLKAIPRFPPDLLITAASQIIQSGVVS